jgi:hypothetical protein
MSHLYTLWKQIWKSYNGLYSIQKKEVEILISFLISGSVVLFLAGVLLTFLKKGLSIFSTCNRTDRIKIIRYHICRCPHHVCILLHSLLCAIRSCFVFENPYLYTFPYHCSTKWRNVPYSGNGHVYRIVGIYNCVTRQRNSTKIREGLPSSYLLYKSRRLNDRVV